MDKKLIISISIICCIVTLGLQQTSNKPKNPVWKGSPPKINISLSNLDGSLGSQLKTSWQLGLLGEYFGDETLQNRQLIRIDPVVNFNWETPPFDPDATYSVRWTGYVNIASAGIWRFITTSDDGVRLYLDDTLIIQNWTIHAPTENYITLQLSAGWHKIKLEHFNRWSQFGIQATMKLEFEGPGQSRIIIPQTALCLDPQASGQPRTYRLSDGREYKLKVVMKR